MIRNYILVAFRNLLKDKLHSSVNIIGLSIGIAASILLLIYLKNELSYDSFHEKSGRIYRVWTEEKIGNKTFKNTVTPFPSGPALVENVPEIEEYVVMAPNQWKAIKNNQNIGEEVFMVSPNFFNIFDFKILNGETDPLDDPKNIVLTQSMKSKYFADENAIGKTMDFETGGQRRSFVITAIVQDPPSNSSIQFDFLISEKLKNSLYGFDLHNWFSIFPENYILVSDNADIDGVFEKLPDVVRKEVDVENEGDYKIGLQPLEDIHLNNEMPLGIVSVSDPKITMILGIVAILILGIASINFVILSLSRAITRAKEVGLRKTFGAYKRNIVIQFLLEAIVIVIISLVLGLILVYLLLPTFNELIATDLAFRIGSYVLMVSFSLIVIIGVLSGCYPAIHLSRTNSVEALKGGVSGLKGNNGVRKLLVGLQFLFAISLLSGTLIVYDQLSFIQNKDLGHDPKNLLVVPIPSNGNGGLSTQVSAGFEEYQTLRNQIMNAPFIESISASSHAIGQGRWSVISFTEQNNTREFNMNIVSPDFFSTLGIQLKEGRLFNAESGSDKRRAVIVNESFVNSFNMEDPIGKKISNQSFNDHEIIGVVKDFNYFSLHGEIEPLVITMNPELFFGGGGLNINIYSDPSPKLIAKYKAGYSQEAIELLRGVISSVDSKSEFSYSFSEGMIESMYSGDKSLSKLILIGCVLSIIIGSMGLYALSSLNIRARLKEISIRKVIGADSKSIYYLISREYFILIAIVLLISIPITWYFIDGWLTNFEYRIGISPIHFIGSGILIVLIALGAISSHLVRAIKTEPVRYLRDN